MSKVELVRVCSICFQASCWHGEFMCDESQGASTVMKKLSYLKKIKLENSEYWEGRIVNAILCKACDGKGQHIEPKYLSRTCTYCKGYGHHG